MKNWMLRPNTWMMHKLLHDQIRSIRPSSNIFFSVLNWGLGHASRSSVVIHALLSKGHTVYLASDGEAGQYLQKQFPNLPYFELPSYKVNYRYDSMFWNMLLQGPKIISAIYKEHQAVRQLLQSQDFDLIISDNRYGAKNKANKSILISHQLQILHESPVVKLGAKHILERMIKGFDEIWVPDEADRGLSGLLSQSKPTHTPIHFIGPLSILGRYQIQDSPQSNIDVLCLLSGPEPKRSELEKILLDQISVYLNTNRDVNIVLIQGKIGKSNLERSQRFNILPFLRGKALASMMAQAKIVVCRSGYSTIMDLELFKKKAILIPTPGQGEQIYLAKTLSEKSKKYVCLDQSEVKKDLSSTLNRMLS